MPQQVTDNLMQKMVPVSIANQLSKYESSKHTRDVTLSGAGLIPISKPAQSSTNTGHIVYRGHTDKQLQTQYHWNRDQTHKLHLDLHLPKHHCLQQSKPKQDEEPQGVQYNWEHEKMHKLHLNLHLPQHSTECHELVADEVHVPVPIVFMLTVPALKYHERLECITYPRSTQKEYEQRMLARKNTSDANITIMCPGYGDTLTKIIEIDRQSMMTAYEMVPILLSRHYLQGCRMLFQFPKDPYVCFLFVKRYLEDGPDRFTKAVLQDWMEFHYTALNRLIVYIRLYRLACKLGLCALMRMAYDSVVDYGAIPGPYCIELAKWVFQRRKSRVDDCLIQEWCFEHIRINFLQLIQNEEWNNLLPNLSGILQMRWKSLVQSSRVLIGGIA